MVDSPLQTNRFQTVESAGEGLVGAVKKNILYLGRLEGDLEKVKVGLAQTLGAEMTPVFIFAKDGPDAAMKAANQKFDAVVVDPRTSRLLEGGFLTNFHTQQNTVSAGLILVEHEKGWQVPAQIGVVDQIVHHPCTEEALVEALVKALVKKAGKSISYAVDAKVLNALLKALRYVCAQFGLQSVEFQKPEARAASPAWFGDVAAQMAINSQRFQGLLVISFEEKCYLKMVSHMLGEEQISLGPDNADAVGEITNMILGNAKSDFTEYDIGMSLPVLLPKGEALVFPPGSAEILMTGKTESGGLSLKVLAYPFKAPS